MTDEKFYDNLVSSYVTNIKRLESLLGGLITIHGSDESSMEIDSLDRFIQEVLRAIVVFLHAMLEEALRSVGSRNLIAFAPRDYFKKIPLIVIETKERKEKFDFADLFTYKDKDMTVKELLQDSIESELYRRSFTDVNHIPSFLRDCGIDPVGMEKWYGDIGDMIKRRHKIVHNADFLRDREGGVESIDVETVLLWLLTTNLFIANVLKRSMEKSANPELLKYHIDKMDNIQNKLMSLNNFENFSKSLNDMNNSSPP